MIEVCRNSIIIRGGKNESKENFKRFHSNFSLYDKVTHKYTFSVYQTINDDIYIPTSVGVSTIQSYFPDHELSENYKATAKSGKIEYAMKHQPRDELQEKAISFLLNLRKDQKMKSAFLSLATGSGKTYVTINFISQMKKKAMVIVDTLELASQWKREFQNHSDLQEEDIAVLSGSDAVEKELKNPTAKIYIAIHRTLGNMLTEDPNSVNNLMNKLKIGIRVFDESHVNFGNICKINSLSNVEYTIFLTATPSRSNFNDNSLYAKVFKQIPYFNGKDMAHEAYHTVIFYPINTKPSLETKLTIKTKYGFSTSRWANFVYNDSYQTILEAIDDIFKKFKLLERNLKIAIMLPTIELIKKLEEDLKDLFKGTEIGLFIGEVKKEERTAALEKQIILTNDKMFDKGIDVKDLEVLINFVQLGSIVKTEQIIGRLRYYEGKQSILFDIVDNGFDETIKQSKIRKRFYKKKVKRIIEYKPE